VQQPSGRFEKGRSKGMSLSWEDDYEARQYVNVIAVENFAKNMRRYINSCGVK
jgi:hypothetical protein